MADSWMYCPKCKVMIPNFNSDECPKCKSTNVENEYPPSEEWPEDRDCDG